MFRKNYFLLLSVTALFLLSSIAVSAQTVALNGKVEVTKKDGTKEPVGDALIELYRTDIKAGFPSTTTNAKGEFSINGLQTGSTFVIVVSGKGISPEVTADLPAGTDNIIIAVGEGDGRHLTEDEVRKLITSPEALAAKEKLGKLTEEQRKAKEEYEKIAKKNETTKQQTALVKKASDEGNKAYNDKNYDVAIAKYEEGYQADKAFVGSAPILLTNKAIALRFRAVENYNKRLKDKSLAAELTPKIKQDITEAITALGTSWKIFADTDSTSISDPKSYEENKQRTLDQAQAVFDIMLQMNLSPENNKEEVKTLTEAYVKTENDKVKKGNAYVNLGQYYTDIYDYDASISTLKSAVETDASNAEALGRLTLALYTQSTLKNDSGDTAAAKTLKQETLTYGQKYLKVAAKDDALRDGISAVVDDIKGSK